jgi:hypothetical protein
MPRPNLISLLDSFVKIGGDVAFVERAGIAGAKKSYAELSPASLLWTRALAAHDIGPGDRVPLWRQIRASDASDLFREYKARRNRDPTANSRTISLIATEHLGGSSFELN